MSDARLSAPAPALICDGSFFAVLSVNAPFLIDGGIAEIPLRSWRVHFERKVVGVAIAIGATTVDGGLLAALHGEEHFLNPTVVDQ